MEPGILDTILDQFQGALNVASRLSLWICMTKM
jgi:hypothetical protein